MAKKYYCYICENKITAKSKEFNLYYCNYCREWRDFNKLLCFDKK